jgi:hypothetical protein
LPHALVGGHVAAEGYTHVALDCVQASYLLRPSLVLPVASVCLLPFVEGKPLLFQTEAHLDHYLEVQNGRSIIRTHKTVVRSQNKVPNNCTKN